MPDTLAGESARDALWRDRFIPAFDKWQQGQVTVAHVAGQLVRSREQLLSEYLTTPEGQRLYEQYTAASSEVVPVVATQKHQSPRTLREYAEDKLEALAKKYEAPGLTAEKGYAAMLRKSPQAIAIYGVLSDCLPLADVPFDRQVSKSKSQAVTIAKMEIDRLVSKAR